MLTNNLPEGANFLAAASNFLALTRWFEALSNRTALDMP
jgi:hypothetical protein